MPPPSNERHELSTQGEAIGELGTELTHFHTHNGFTIIYGLGSNELFVEFEISEDDGDGETEARGSVKWDGCMNWETSSSCMMHSCGPDHVEAFAVALKQVWKLARRIMPNATEDFGT